MEEVEYIPPARFPSAIGDPRLRASFVAVFVCRKTVECAEQVIESIDELWVDAPLLARPRLSSWLRECHRSSIYSGWSSIYSASLLLMDATSVSSSNPSSVGSEADFSPAASATGRWIRPSSREAVSTSPLASC
jgi:hypothetical protein